MNVWDAIHKRKSIRKFNPYKITEQEIYSFERAIELSPSAGNLRPINFKFIFSQEENLKLSQICSNQKFISNASLNIILSANYSKITPKYGDRGIRYALLEAGHIAQNICLMAVENGLGACCIGAFDDKWMIKEFNLKYFPVYIIAIGKHE